MRRSSPCTRRAGAACLAALLLLAAGLPVPARAQTRLVSAEAFRDSVGVVTHPTYFNTPYGAWGRVLERLRELGVRHIRAPIVVSANSGWNRRLDDALRAAAAEGLGLNLVVGRDCAYDGRLEQCLAAAREELPHGSVSALEWPNEHDLSGRADWASDLASWGRELHAQAKADPVLSPATVVGPSFGRSWGAPTLGDQSAFLDAGNIHPYTGARSPDPLHLAAEQARIALVSGGKPVIATEAGFHTSPGFANTDQPAADEPTAAVYTLRTVLEHLASGIDRTFLYELVDVRDDPLDSQANYGLLRHDFSPKPAFTALRHLLGMLGSRRPATLTPPPWRTDGDPDDLRSLAVQHDADTYTLILWRTAAVWDRDAKTSLAVAAEPLALTVPAGATVATGDPLQGPALTPRRVDHGRLVLELGAAPAVVRLTVAPGAARPAAAAPAPSPAAPPPAAASPAPAPAAARPAPAPPARDVTKPRLTRLRVATRGGRCVVRLRLSEHARVTARLRGAGVHAAVAARRARERALGPGDHRLGVGRVRAGRHVVRLRVRDRAGNVRRYAVAFRVRRSRP